jgi:hypothetical protein
VEELKEEVTPTVEATLRFSKDHVWVWTVRKCPFCGKTHNHGAGDGADPRTYLGSRVAHCLCGGEYRLVEATK